jgi:hypothetical protein
MSSESPKNNLNLEGIKHLIQCHCILPQYRNSKNPVFHQFAVFSILDLKSDTVENKFAECNNCGAAHKVIDICRSEIVIGKDEVTSQLSISDLKHSIPDSLFELLQTYNRELPDFEYSEFILEQERWGKYIILTREEINGDVQGKLVRFISHDKFRVESYVSRGSI